MATTSKATTKSDWKVCSRGHKYRGSHCPYCWKRTHISSSTRQSHK